MSARTEDGVSLCQRALQIITELCLGGHVNREKCADIFPTESNIPDISVSLLAVLVGFCGLALLVVSLFVFWKLCWPIWRSKAISSHSETVSQGVLPEAPAPAPHVPPSLPERQGLQAEKLEKKEEEEEQRRKVPEVKVNGCRSVKSLEAAMKISQTSPDIPAEVQQTIRERLSKKAKIQKQSTEPTSFSRHNSFRRHLRRQMNVTEYDYEEQALVVRILKALDLPAKDFTGTSDPYVKIYLLPERKKKFQTRVHRKTLNPTFDEVFCFPVEYDQLCNRKLHFSVYDFDRFTSHDMIGEVVVDNLFELSDLSREAVVWKDILASTTESVDLGEIMYSLCYLPTAGRMTLTVIKCRNLKAMDITGSSDPYVKVSLICDGRRLKKRKTTTKKSTLNPVYNEAIIFDIPPENVEQVSLSIVVMDYDRVGHNEVIGVCRTGPDAEGLGRDHWNEMLAYPRKPITHWHALCEWPGRGSSFESQASCPSPKPPQTP
ncbi:hypothetical protein AMELA_G00181930 [Ameiurus melas]|uniref:C2 domain-containing protein n=1 Tax=Ameiurus melas TaxID=219545 RepID=A0A7J6AAD0_AMEME|nr:hypothetical protein AMELA_G00181930 [Ameiurus melas]